MRRTAVCSLITGLACLAAAGPVGAAGWSTPMPLPATWSSMSAGFDSEGRATVGYAEITSVSPVVTRIALAQRQPDGSWVDQYSQVSTGGDVPVNVSVAVGPDGSAAACITSLTTTDVATAQERRLATYRAAGSSIWESPTEIVGPNKRSGRTAECDPVVAANGFAAVLVLRTENSPAEQPDNEDDALLLSTHAPSGSWTAPQQINPAANSAEWGQIETDALGNITVAYNHRYAEGPPQDYSVRVRTRAASNGVLSSPVILTNESGGVSAGSPRLAVNAAGRAVTGFQIEAQLSVTTRAAASGAFEALHPVFTGATASSSNARAVGVSPNGISYVLYWRQGPMSSGNDVVGMVRRGTFGSWTSHNSASEPNADLRDGGIAFLGQDAHAVFTATIGGGGGDPGLGIFQSARWPSFGSSPDAAVDLATPGVSPQIDQVIADNAGSIAAFHSSYATGALVRSVTAYDGGPPVAASSAVPATVNVGETVQLRVTFADAWSPIASVKWDFGDGTATATGGTVTHGWAATGPYTVVATGRDSQGNEATKTFLITVVQPPPPAVPGGPPSPPVAAADTVRPGLTLSLPACKKALKPAACARLRTSAAAWKTVRGTTSDNVKVTRVTVTATRRKKGRLKAKTLTGKTNLSGGKWSATLKGLGAGTWTFTVTAFDRAGNRRSAKRTVTLRG